MIRTQNDDNILKVKMDNEIFLKTIKHKIEFNPKSKDEAH